MNIYYEPHNERTWEQQTM